MASLLTNTSAISAVSSLTATQRSLDKTQRQVSTGLRVGGADDNAAYYAIATNLRTQIGQLGAVQDTLNLTQGIARVTSVAVDQVTSLLQGVAKDLVTAAGSGVDLHAVQLDIASRQQQISSVARSATFSGVNWLVGNRTADVTIDEHHVLDDTYQDILDQGALPAHTQALDPVPSYAPTTDYGDARNYQPSTQPDPPPHVYHDTVTYAANADETNAQGAHQVQTVDYVGTDTDNILTYTGYQSDFGGSSQSNTPVWQSYASEDRYRVAVEPVSPSNTTVSGTGDFRQAETDHVPVGVSTSAVETMDVDTNQFLLFTDYTGTTTVMEDTKDSSGAATTGNWTESGYTHAFTSTTPYTSYSTDNGFDVDPGALDGDLRGINSADSLATVPEDDLAFSSKISVLNFDITNSGGISPTEMLRIVNSDIGSLATISSKLGTLASGIDQQSTFVSAISNALTGGVGSLVDADLNETSSRLTALQTQQALGIQSLSIANDNAKQFLKLFGT